MRQIRVSRIDTSRDPGVPGAVWYSGAGSINEPTPTPEPPTIDVYYEALPEPPEPSPISDETGKKWQMALEQANKVVPVLQAERDFSGMELVGAVADLLDDNPTADKIIALYRKRMEARRNG
jgi:hypothetical protein